MRRALVLAALSVAVMLGAGAPVASADGTDESFAGCPMLVENRSTGSCVERLQRDLNVVNTDYRLPTSGVFGAKTRIAVLDFQGRNHLGADGRVGRETATLLAQQANDQGDGGTESPTISLSPEDRCAKLGSGWIVHRGDRCILDGVVAGGLSPMECARKLAGAKAFEEALKKGMGEEVARAMATTAAKRVSLANDLLGIGKCVFIDEDPEEVQKYKSVPMPS